MDHRMVENARWDQHHITVLQAVFISGYFNRHISLHKKIELVIIVDMAVHFRKIVVFIIIDLIILRQHILSRAESALQFLFHAAPPLTPLCLYRQYTFPQAVSQEIYRATFAM